MTTDLEIPNSIINLLLNTAGSLLAGLIGFVFGYVLRSYRKSRDRAAFERIYGSLVRDPKVVDIVLTTRKTPVETINENEFLHADLNEVRAYAQLSNLLKESGVVVHVNSSRTDEILFSRGHLITLGSSSVNRITETALKKLKGQFPQIKWKRRDVANDIPESTFTIEGELYDSLVDEEGHVLRDSCVVIRANNPFNPKHAMLIGCLLYTSPSPRDGLLSRMPSSA